MAKSSRRASWGSITEVERGRRYRIRWWGKDGDGTYRRMTCTVRGTRHEAEKRRSELMLEHSDEAPCPTIGDVWERYAVPDLERRVEDGDVASNTLTQYTRWWAKHVEPRWGDVPCDSVRPLAVQQWISGLTLSQAQNATLVLRKAMDYAVRYEWCRSNPMREKYLMPSKSTVDRRDKGIWTLPELEHAWKRVWGTWMEPAFLLSAFGSARVGESLAPLACEVELRLVDDVPVAVVPIVRQVEHNGRRVASRMKTDESSRVIVMAGKAATRLHEIANNTEPSWYLTNDGFGGTVSQDRYTSNWKKLGMEHPYRNLRNSWQTWMRWDMRVPVHFIEAMMGHKLKGTTGQYYDRPQADMFADVIADAYRRNPYDSGWSVGM